MPGPGPARSRAQSKLQLQFQQAVALHQGGSLAKAAAIYQEILAAHPDHADALHLLGVLALQEKNTRKAIDLIAAAIALNPQSAAYHCNLGIALQENKQLELALESYDRALRLSPQYAQAHYNRGNALRALQQGQAALASYERAIALKADDADAHFCRGATLHDLGQLDAALQSYDRAIAIKPDHAEAFCNRGLALKELGRPAEALLSYQRAISIRPGYAQAYSNRGVVQLAQGQLEAALASYAEAIQADPAYAEAYYNRGVMQQEQGQQQAAIADFDKAIELRGDYAEAWSNRGNALQAIKQFGAAVESYDKAISIDAGYVNAHYNRGNALQALRQLDAAADCYAKACELQPDLAEAHWNQSLVLLLGGKYAEGWVAYEWRWKNHKEGFVERNFAQPLWLGAEPIAGKRILLHAEQGLGDSLQFIRYAELVAALGAEVIVEVQRTLIGLLQGLAGVSEWVARGDKLPGFDYQCPLLSLPLAFGTTLEDIPKRQAYIFSKPAQVAQWRSRLGPATRPRVGLVWSGSLIHSNDSNRSVKLASLLPYLPAHCDYFSLQKELREDDQEALRGCESIRYFGAELVDFSETAALCELMDLVISVDTSVAHLSAALGKPTWILLPYVPDWRWLLDRDDSPWYPGAKLYRQASLGDWTSTLERLKADLLKLGTQPTIGEGKALHQQGRLAQAKAVYQQLLASPPDKAEALHLLGVIAYQENNNQLALALFDEAIAINPAVAAFHGNRGNVLRRLKQCEAAVESYDQALRLNGDYAEASYNRGNALKELGRLDAALASYEQAIRIKPLLAAAHVNRGILLLAMNRYAEALQSHDRAIEISPRNVAAHINRGMALKRLKRPEDAVAAFDRAIGIDPDCAEAHSNRGTALQELGQLPQALASYDQAIAINPGYSEAFANRATALQELGLLDAALASYDEAIRLDPANALACSNRGTALQEQLRLDAALASFDLAIAANPEHAEAYWNKSLVLLLSGQLEAAWPLYEWRWKNEKLGNLARFPGKKLWLGAEPIKGKRLLLHAEQGFGDTIQFIRYASLLAQRGAHVIAEVQAPLAGILQGVEGVAEWCIAGSATPDFDYHCPLLSLPLAFKTGLDSVPARPSYLQAQAGQIEPWRQRLGPPKQPRVGLVWSGSAANPNDHKRNIKLSLLLEHLPEQFEYFCLQKGIRAEDQETILVNPRVRIFDDELMDFQGTAGLCELMDVVLTVDTSIAHLAGALGRPTWILLPLAPDWRWMLGRNDSPWYPSVRLYRQEDSQGWAPVLPRVRADLLALAAPPQPLPEPVADAYADAGALHQRGIIAFQEKRPEEAEALIRRAIALDPGNAVFHFNLGNVLRASRRPVEALQSFDRAIAAKPDQAEAHFSRGVTLHELGQFEAAAASYAKAIVIRPGHAQAQSNRGAALKELKRLPEALACYDEAIRIQPGFADAHSNRGVLLNELGRFDAAVESYSLAIKLKPDYAGAWFNRGVAKKELKRLAEALDDYDQAIKLDPSYADAYNNRGNALTELGQFDAAAASYRRAIEIRPASADAYYNLGNALVELKQFEAAVASYKQASAISPGHFMAHSNCGDALVGLERYEEAIASYDLAIAAKPDFAGAHSNRGAALQALQRLGPAIESFDRAIKLDPDYAGARWNKAVTLLTAGDFKQGWPLYEWRWKNKRLGKTLRFPAEKLWLGDAPIKGKRLLLHAEQGFGDTIQFIRYARLAADLGAIVIAEVPAALIPLLQGVAGVDRWVAAGQPLPDYDYHCPMLSTPLALGSSIEGMPASGPYLVADSGKVAEWRDRLGPRSWHRVGLVWSGSAANSNDHNRSIKLSRLLEQLPQGFEYFCLQKGIRAEDLETLRATPRVRNFDDELMDFQSTAGLCELMDVVLTVDTSIAHLSAALGRPTWILLPFAPDWRWMLERADSPWYPSAKLYRQTTAGQWGPVLDLVHADLLRLLAGENKVMAP